MKLYIIIPIVSILLFGCARAQEVTFEGVETHDSITTLKGSKEPFTGKVVAFNINGKKTLELEYKNGRESGTNRSWYPNGNIMNETQITNGKIDGLWIDYFENGKKQNEITYETDYMNGPCKRWYESGQVKEQGNYQHCREEGYWVYYFENGQKQTAGDYHQAQKVGVWTVWNEKGEVIKTEKY